jgi:hypothetical protein
VFTRVLDLVIQDTAPRMRDPGPYKSARQEPGSAARACCAASSVSGTLPMLRRFPSRQETGT